MVESIQRVYDANTSLIRTIVVSNTWDEMGRTLRVERTRTDAHDVLVESVVTDYLYDGKGYVGFDRRVADGADAQIRREEVRNHVPVLEVGMVRETRIYGPDDALIEFRYSTTDRDERGRLVAQDESTFSPKGVQTRRFRQEYSHTRAGELIGLTRYRFDKNDDEISREVGTRSVEDRFQTTTEWILYDAKERVTGYRDENIYRNEEGRIVQRETVLYNADGYATRERSTVISYDQNGKVHARRTMVRTF
tara:strand:+ start:2523 stop:3272 length:750 start_codon:yes stop_codon:yes gene_type:complete